ncbi:pyridoxine 5'-phosphate oxidase C-terminal domain-containing protein [Streptomyces sp. NPDC004561]
MQELRPASEAAWEQARRNASESSFTWTFYRLRPEAVGFLRGGPDRRHVRLEYRRTEFGWRKNLLWP